MTIAVNNKPPEVGSGTVITIIDPGLLIPLVMMAIAFEPSKFARKILSVQVSLQNRNPLELSMAIPPSYAGTGDPVLAITAAWLPSKFDQ